MLPTPYTLNAALTPLRGQSATQGVVVSIGTLPYTTVLTLSPCHENTTVFHSNSSGTLSVTRRVTIAHPTCLAAGAQRLRLHQTGQPPHESTDDAAHLY